MNLSYLAGNRPLKARLESEGGRRGLSHAYILSGPAGVGKRTLASLLCAAFVCTGGEEDAPCLTCAPCRKAMGGIHPDVIRAGADGKGLTVAQVRELRADAYIRPNEAERKVYLIENAQLMNASAQNAMLKLLEEGPAYAAFLLLTDNSGALLRTVRSRCEELKLAPVSPAEAEGWLKSRYPERPADELRAAARACEGVLGRAVDALAGAKDGEDEVLSAALALVEAAAANDELAVLECCVGLEKWDREKLCRLLDEMLLLLRDALAHTAGVLNEADPRRRATAESAARALPARRLIAVADKLKDLRGACAFHIGAGHLAGWLCACLFQEENRI